MTLPFALIALVLSPFAASSRGFEIHAFDPPIDAVSVGLPSENSTASVSAFVDGRWSEWQELHVENEQDPLSRESNLVIFAGPASRIRIRSSDTASPHPIRVSQTPVRYTVAATTDPGAPRILTRDDWGADESFLFRSSPSTPAPAASPADTSDNGETGTVSQRVTDCEEAQRLYPKEFKTKRRTAKDDEGRTYRWPLEYSREVRLLVVHHTAVKVEGDKRSGAERVRALYQYHAQNRGWGDVGYHYLVDEDGRIYEGKAGGNGVVGGHAYCNNIGTIGVALLGNFDVEEPTQKQLKSLQWLLHDLARIYDIDPSRSVTFHGKRLDPIVGHKDLLATDCPGHYVTGSLAQIRNHVTAHEIYASVKLPPAPKPTASIALKNRASTRAAERAAAAEIRTPFATGPLTRAARRLLSTTASQALRRKLGTNPGHVVESAVADRLAARLGSSSSRRSVRSVSSSHSSSSRTTASLRSRSSAASTASPSIRIRLTKKETGASSCAAYDLQLIGHAYRGTVTCLEQGGTPMLINDITLEDYLKGLAEEPDSEPYEKQRAFAIAARTYAAYYTDPNHRKFPGMPYDGDDSPARFQAYGGLTFERQNAAWVQAVLSTSGKVLTKDGEVIRAPYFSSDDGRTRSPEEAGWNNFPFASVFSSKEDPWCEGLELRGHGVGMSGCGAKGQANDGKTAEEILRYYYPGTILKIMSRLP